MEVPKERYISPEKRQKMDYDWYNDITMEYQKIINLLEKWNCTQCIKSTI